MNSTLRTALYWTATALAAFALGGSGFANVTAQPPVVEALTGLGYPLYFPTILGSWKIAGALALLVPGAPLLKEWAYAGATFAMTGAFASHMLHGDAFGESVASLVILALVAASYALRPATRRVAEAFAVAARPDVHTQSVPA